MKEKQRSKRIESTQRTLIQQTRNSSKKQVNRSESKKTLSKNFHRKRREVIKTFGTAKKEVAPNLPADITKINKSLTSLLERWNKADKENQKLLCMILWGVPERKRSRRKLAK